jgi:hypothetical protein
MTQYIDFSKKRNKLPKFNEQGYYEIPIGKHCNQNIFVVKYNNKLKSSIYLNGRNINVPEKFLGRRVMIKLEVVDDKADIVNSETDKAI